jgi:hypothetical protein
MATFEKGTAIETTEPTIEVTVSPQKPLPVGKHTFQLVVMDDANNASAAATVDVIIRDTIRPTAVLEVSDKTPEFGRSFTLSGKDSSDVPPGKVVKYIWTLLE